MEDIGLRFDILLVEEMDMRLVEMEVSEDRPVAEEGDEDRGVETSEFDELKEGTNGTEAIGVGIVQEEGEESRGLGRRARNEIPDEEKRFGVGCASRRKRRRGRVRVCGCKCPRLRSREGPGEFLGRGDGEGDRWSERIGRLSNKDPARPADAGEETRDGADVGS